MQGAIAAAYSHERSTPVRRATVQKAGKLWEDADFETCNFGPYCECGFSEVHRRSLSAFSGLDGMKLGRGLSLEVQVVLCNMLHSLYSKKVCCMFDFVIWVHCL